MSRLPWLRIYTEARNDRKLDLLSDAHHRVWFRLLLFSAESEPRGVFAIDDLLAIEVAGADDELLTEALDRMERLRLIEIEDGLGYFPAFGNRQYVASEKPSDAPDRVAERVRKHRAKGADVTPCNAM